MFTEALLLCAGLVAGQVPSDVFPTNQRNHNIPLNFSKARQEDIRELILFASTDLGRTWQQMAVVSGDQKNFTFNAPADGQFWLQVASVNRQGKQEPENIAQSPAQQKMLIDTLKPHVRVTSAQRQGDDILVGWELQEDHPDWAGFKLEYQVQPSLQWQQAQVQPAANGQTKIRIGNASPVLVRVHMRDVAGNVALAQAEVQGTVTLAHQIPTPAPIPPAPTPTPPPAPPPGTLLPTGASEPAPPPALISDDTRPAAPIAPVGVSEMEAPRKTMRPTNAPQEKVPAWAPPQVNNQARPVATSQDSAPPIAPQPAPLPPARKQLPKIDYVNSPEVTLEFELSKVGPSGVGSVDLWWTQNDGQTWERYAVDPDPKGPGRHQRIVELPGDGVFGFQLVVKSRAGLGRKEPRAGDVPEIRIEVDTNAPIAQLFAPVPDPQRANSLILSWSAKDANLTTHPINLEWAERREGPWHSIANNVPNSGRHSWQLNEQVPVQVYLRLRARDIAGNEGVAVTPEPLLVDLSEPEGRLLNVTVPPRR